VKDLIVDSEMSDRATRLAGLYAALAAVAALLIAPLLALSYFGIEDGASELASGTVSAWAEPARDLADGLLTWASPDRVYATFVQALALLFPAVFLCALAVRRQRPDALGRLERWGWRIALFGYGLAAVGLIVAFFVLVAGSPEGAVLNAVFLGLLIPGMAVSAIGSTTLGIALIRSRYTPKLTAWLLAISLPSMLFIPDLLGHNSLGMLPVFAAWGVTGLQLGRRPTDRVRSQQSTAAVW
jgi:hypothetical protein